MGDRLFGRDFFSSIDSSHQTELLNTIRVPKNLLYLTDRLPKPKYLSITPKRQNATTYNTKSIGDPLAENISTVAVSAVGGKRVKSDLGGGKSSETAESLTGTPSQTKSKVDIVAGSKTPVLQQNKKLAAQEPTRSTS